jgi:hypothetical protein
MTREYLRGIFEMIQISGSEQLINEFDKDKIKKATQSLDDKLSLKFESFFHIDHVVIKQTPDDLIHLHAEITSNYALVSICVYL